MQWAISKSHESIGEFGEKLENQQMNGLGDNMIVYENDQLVGQKGVKVTGSDELQSFQKSEECKLRREERAQRKADRLRSKE